MSLVGIPSISTEPFDAKRFKQPLELEKHSVITPAKYISALPAQFGGQSHATAIWDLFYCLRNSTFHLARISQLQVLAQLLLFQKLPQLALAGVDLTAFD